jgi:DNA polymerase
MVMAESHGYPVVLHVHDEVVSETPQDFGSVAQFEQLVTIIPPWANGLPLKAEAWKGHRYRK